MAQDIVLQGATYPDVPAVLLPKSGGGTAQFDDTSDANAAAGDIASGKTAYVNGTKVTGTASGGGGASRQVIGTFTAAASEKGTSKSISLNYSGNGYPISVQIFPSEGSYNASGTLYNAVQRYAVKDYFATKSYMTGEYATPKYNKQNYYDYLTVLFRYKNSTSEKTTYGQATRNYIAVYGSSSASETSGYQLSIKDKTTLIVFIANTSYGFKDGVEYTYIVTYSS